MTTHSSILAWEIPRRVDPGGLESTALQRVGHNWATHQVDIYANKSCACVYISKYIWLCVSVYTYISIYGCVYIHSSVCRLPVLIWHWISRGAAGTVQSLHPYSPASQMLKSSHFWFCHWLARDRRVFSAYIFINFNSVQFYWSFFFMKNKHSWTHSVSWDMKYRHLCTGDTKAVISLLWKSSASRQDVATAVWQAFHLVVTFVSAHTF